jgi:hypothetical protein
LSSRPGLWFSKSPAPWRPSLLSSKLQHKVFKVGVTRRWDNAKIAA